MSAAGGPGARSRRPAPARSRRAVSISFFFAGALGGVVGAAAAAFLLALLGMFMGGLIGVQIGYGAGPLLGGALGVSGGLAAAISIERRRARVTASPLPPDPRVLRIFPEGRAGMLISWIFALLLLASPFGLLQFGFLPPLSPIRLAVTAFLGCLCFLQCARVRRFWPALVLLGWPAAFVFAIETRFPCWRGSNAAWCGHACDGPPEPGCGPDDFGIPNPPAGRD